MANNRYSERVIQGMQLLFGEGFLSPGGAAEVADMVAGEAIAGRTVLDFGCGIGGGALLLAGTWGAAKVIAVDIEPNSLERTRQAAQAKGLSSQIETLRIQLGPLPLPNACADVVFTKDVVCHIADKAAAFAEMARVLRPGGRLICADFIENKPDASDPSAASLFDDFVAVLKEAGLHFHFERREVYERALAAAGFEEITVLDHTTVSATVARREYDLVTGPEGGSVRDLLGEDFFKLRIRLSETRALALERRCATHLHIRATNSPKGF
ncbi:MAG: methyltransferase domain-containing protein [Alphaproteobacteria bacterium]|nr:methyltransferase domain-containing protein [Alphaproteobacteria bacterium]